MMLIMGEKPSKSDGPMQDLANFVCGGDLDKSMNQIQVFYTSRCDSVPVLTENNRNAQYELSNIPYVFFRAHLLITTLYV